MTGCTDLDKLDPRIKLVKEVDIGQLLPRRDIHIDPVCAQVIRSGGRLVLGATVDLGKPDQRDIHIRLRRGGNTDNGGVYGWVVERIHTEPEAAQRTDGQRLPYIGMIAQRQIEVDISRRLATHETAERKLDNNQLVTTLENPVQRVIVGAGGISCVDVDRFAGRVNGIGMQDAKPAVGIVIQSQHRIIDVDPQVGWSTGKTESVIEVPRIGKLVGIAGMDIARSRRINNSVQTGAHKEHINPWAVAGSVIARIIDEGNRDIGRLTDPDGPGCINRHRRMGSRRQDDIIR